MKKTILYISLLFSTQFTFGYNKMLDQGTRWYQTQGFLWNYGKNYFEVKGDTSIGGQKYQKIFGTSYFSCRAPGSGMFKCSYPISPLTDDEYDSSVSRGLLGYYREDSLTKKVYKWDNSKEKDELVHDFDLAFGDTADFILWETPSSEPTLVDSVDTISLGGTPIPRYRLSNSGVDAFGQVYYYEGIGSSCGFLNRCPSFEAHSTLTCYIKSDSRSIGNCENLFVYDSNVVCPELLKVNETGDTVQSDTLISESTNFFLNPNRERIIFDSIKLVFETPIDTQWSNPNFSGKVNGTKIEFQESQEYYWKYGFIINYLSKNHFSFNHQSNLIPEIKTDFRYLHGTLTLKSPSTNECNYPIRANIGYIVSIQNKSPKTSPGYNKSTYNTKGEKKKFSSKQMLIKH